MIGEFKVYFIHQLSDHIPFYITVTSMMDQTQAHMYIKTGGFLTLQIYYVAANAFKGTILKSCVFQLRTC